MWLFLFEEALALECAPFELTDPSTDIATSSMCSEVRTDVVLLTADDLDFKETGLEAFLIR